MKKLTCLVLVLAVLASVFAGCQKSPVNVPAEATPEGVKTIRVASLPLQIASSVYYMHEMGWDVENGFNIDLSTYASGAPINEALGAKLWDISAIGGAAVMSLAKYDAVQIFALVDAGAGIEAIVRADSPIMSVKGYNPNYPEVYGSPETVKGATILVPVGSGSHLQISNWLEILGLKESDVSLVHMEYAASYQAFTSGQADVTTTAFPFTAKYHAEGYQVASSLAAQSIPYYDNIVVAREFYDDPANKDVLVAFVKQLMRVADAFREDEELYVKTVMDWYKLNGNEVEESTVREEITQKPFLTTKEAMTFDTGASLKIQAEFNYSVGKITEDELKKVESNITSDIVNAALGR